MIRRALRKTNLKIAVLAAAGAALALSPVMPVEEVLADDPPGGPKLQRNMRRVARIMDEMLIDSPNWLVPGRDNTRAMYIPGHGTVFTFQATLVTRWGRNGLRIFGRDSWVFWDDDDDWDDDWDDDPRDRRDRRDDDDADDDGRSWRSRGLDREERRYERGQREVAEVLMDYGDALDEMPRGEWVSVVVYLGDAELFYDKDIHNLSMKVKIEDLIAYRNDSLDDEALLSRMVTEEY